MTTEPRNASDADDGFHEIQLNGKQLVFLGMATTIVSVVIFLCGVLVGRGVRPLEPVAEAASNASAAADSQPAATEIAAATPPAPATEPVAAPQPEPELRPQPSASEPSAPAAGRAAVAATAQASAPTPVAAPGSDKSYYDALAKSVVKPAAAARAATPEPKPADPKPADRKPAEPGPSAAAPRVAEGKPIEPATVDANAAPMPTAEPVPAPTAAATGGAIAVQVAALSSRSDAEVIARRLSGKGYAAYVLAPDAGAKAIYKVRVGNYASADEAERVKRRLAQEEQLKPWVIR